MSERYFSGPWRYQEGADKYTHIVRAGGNYFVCQLPQDTSGVAKANARLIAAAPELLDALKALCDAVDNGKEKNIWPAKDKARAAIAKATAP